MKHIKKVITLFLALAMMLAMSSVTFAADGDLTVDAKVTVSGFEEGDTVTAYQFITWDAENNNWKVAEGVGLTLDQITDGLTKEELATLASHTDKMTAATGTTTGTTWEKTCGTVETAGSYLVLVTANDASHIYNPAVVSADFDGTNSAAVNLSEDTANIKKQNVTVEKEANNAPDDYDVQVGDIVPFTVTVTVPQYNTNWTEPYFAVSDTLSSGLTIADGHTPVVKNGTKTLVKDTDYTLTKGSAGQDGFTITFTENYLKENASASLTIEYSALVGEGVKDTSQVHEEKNKVKLEFSNNPSDSSKHKKKEVETHHYTFAIDANRLGEGSQKTNELIKVGVDKNGNPITQYNEKESMPTGASPLAGATFKLTGVGPNNTPNGFEQTFTTQADGRITFNNLEVGTYQLEETKAPAGYTKDTTGPHTVKIEAEYNADSTLKNYTITIDGTATSTYTATTSESTTTYEAPANGNPVFPINNKKGAELPSTGGMGTTIFYILGALLVVGCGIVLVSRRRMNKNK
ncbi:isopeptide-forming domain-containing fimbrial protein [Eubacterium sp. AB3007]|uniref:isopeptide-forming domain-containing fimbrial protein n=1 Tax=Eubacterium sp. AB3007 TaxID=1392487 RepID=UPI000486A049|nr:isopeptide-forming domain-containing fimbrial protein [Eubacterium sp. AB3007]